MFILFSVFGSTLKAVIFVTLRVIYKIIFINIHIQLLQSLGNHWHSFEANSIGLFFVLFWFQNIRYDYLKHSVSQLRSAQGIIISNFFICVYTNCTDRDDVWYDTMHAYIKQKFQMVSLVESPDKLSLACYKAAYQVYQLQHKQFINFNSFQSCCLLEVACVLPFGCTCHQHSNTSL